MATESAHTSTAPSGFGRYLPIAARILLGLVFLVFGLNGFFNFIPMPKTPMPAGAVAFGAALMKSGYFFQLLKGVETLVGVLLLANRFVPLALAVIAPVVVNIFAFHLFLEPSGIPIAAVILLLEIYLAWSYRRVYLPMLAMRVAPGGR